jgi:hypothetical protein
MKFYKFSIIIACFFLAYIDSMAQCGCSGAAIGGVIPAGATASSGIQKKGYIFSSAFYRYAYGNQYYSGDSKTGPGSIKEYEIHYIGLVLDYGLLDDFTIEGELGYFPRKMQDFYQAQISSRGFSHVVFSGKYNFFRNVSNEFEINAGLGIKIPLSLEESTSPQNVLPSTGAFGGVFELIIHKGFKKEGINLFLINRSELNSKNKNEYQYGPAFYSSFFISKIFLKQFNGIIELRNELRMKDKSHDSTFVDSGGLNFIISPKINYNLNDFSISAMLDFPFYQYYNGHQLGNKLSAALAISYNIKFD